MLDQGSEALNIIVEFNEPLNKHTYIILITIYILFSIN